jgi:hypothetical protein
MCPHCGQEAPLVYRGPLAYCSACNRPRVPLTAAGVNLTGKPAKFGGKVAAVVGWTILAGTTALALIVGAVLQALLGAAVGWIVGGVLAAIGIAAAVVLVMGGRLLQRTGERAAFGAKRDAVFALARAEGGILRAGIVGTALGVPAAEADAFLTNLSREPDAGVTLEVDGDGKLYYRFPGIAPELPWPPPAPGTPAPDQGKLRVARTEVAGPPAVDAGEQDAADADEGAAKRTLRGP